MTPPRHPLTPFEGAPYPEAIASVPEFRSGAVPFGLPADTQFIALSTVWGRFAGKHKNNETFLQMGNAFSIAGTQLASEREAILLLTPEIKHARSLGHITSVDALSWCRKAISFLAASYFLLESGVSPLLKTSPDDPSRPQIDPYYDADFLHNGELAVHLKDDQMRALGLQALAAEEIRWYTGEDVFVRAKHPAEPSPHMTEKIPGDFSTRDHTTLTPRLKHSTWMRYVQL